MIDLLFERLNLMFMSYHRGTLEVRVGIEPTMAELQSAALPLCYRALNEQLCKALYCMQ